MAFKNIIFFILLTLSNLNVFSQIENFTLNFPPCTITDIKAPFLGENLNYDIYWGLLKVGEASIKINKLVQISSNTCAYLIESYAKSSSLIENIFKVNDYNSALLDINLKNSYGYYKDIHEGKFSKQELVMYNYNNSSFYSASYKKKNLKEDFGALPFKVYDVLSSLYLFREKNLKKEESYIININTGKDWQLKVSYQGKEKIKTPLGKFKCDIYQPEVGENGIFMSNKDKKLFVYISEKENLPVSLRAEVFIGSVTAKLKKVQK